MRDQDLWERGLLAFESGRLDDAYQAFRELVDNDPNSDLADNALYQIGMIECMRGRPEAGLAAFQQCLAQYRGSDAAPLAAAQAKHLEAEIREREEGEARKLFHQARDLAAKRDFALAEKTLLECVERFPDSSLADNVYLTLSTILSIQGDFQEARKILQLILERFPASDAARMVPVALRRLELDEAGS